MTFGNNWKCKITELYNWLALLYNEWRRLLSAGKACKTYEKDCPKFMTSFTFSKAKTGQIGVSEGFILALRPYVWHPCSNSLSTFFPQISSTVLSKRPNVKNLTVSKNNKYIY